MSEKLDASFPWFGGKRAVAAEVWRCYGNRAKVRTGNEHRERIWFSPACLGETGQQSLFGGSE